MSPWETMTVEHGTPKKVMLSQIEEELELLLGGPAAGEGARRSYARALTLAVFCDNADAPEVMDELVGHIITRYSARAIVIRTVPGAGEAELEAWIRKHCVIRGEGEMQLCAEQITLHGRADSIQQVHNSVLALRLGALPLVVWWRGQPDLENSLFVKLLESGDQIILDSACFTAPTLQLGGVVGRLYREYGRVPFGDINWARLTPWRELIAQFFDARENLKYLGQLTDIDVEYSSRDGGNPAQAILVAMWLATMLNWQVVEGSWKSNGIDRSLRLLDKDREVKVEIRGKASTEAQPGWLDSINLRSSGKPGASFQVKWCGEGCATTLVKIGTKVTERTAALNVPSEVELVCAEFDASQRDRVYHQALQILEQLLT